MVSIVKNQFKIVKVVVENLVLLEIDISNKTSPCVFKKTRLGKINSLSMLLLQLSQLPIEELKGSCQF